MRKFLINSVLYIFLLSLFFGSFSVSEVNAAGATLFLSPGSGSFAINKSFTVKVLINSGDVTDGVNASEGVIKYDPAFLTVTKLNNTSSIFKLWTTDPTFSNTAGTITYGGGSPGSYKGATGEIFNISFTAKKAGETTVQFNSGLVLAADGKGTNVFGGFGNAKFTITEAETKAEETKKPVTEQPKEEVKGILPPLPDVSSKTHPKDDIWYSNNVPEFTWKVLSDLTGVSYEITNEEKTDPGAENDGIVESAKFDNQPDGAWYFHIKYQNRYGWGQTAHTKFMVDATPPESFIISVDNEGDVTNPTPKLRFSTKDLTSGIDHFTAETGIEKIQLSVAEASKGYYQVGPLTPGEYTTNIAAYDLAGNVSSSSVKYIIDALRSPIITDIPKIISRKDELIIRGTSFYPRVSVKLFIDDGKDKKEYMIDTDDGGNWSYFHKDKLENGSYDVYARIIDKRGAESLDSTRHILSVVSPSIIENYGWLIILILLIIIVGLILYILYLEKEHNDEKTRIMIETREVKEKLSKIFSALREEVDELIELADKRPGLSESERRVKEKLQESLDISEEFINKEVEDVEKEIKLKQIKSKK